MTGQFIGFAFWGFIGCIFIYLGIRSFFLKEPMVFWANAQMFEVNDVKKYNYAVGKMFFLYGIVLIFLGVPLLFLEKNPAWIFLSVVGIMFESITLMVVYSMIIEKKYKKNRD